MQSFPSRAAVLAGRASRAALRPVAAVLIAAMLAGCVPVLMGSALVGTTVVVADRRSPGIQLEDQTIEMRVRDIVGKEFGDKVQVTPSSYNRTVLLVGAVPDEATKTRVGQLARGQQNVQAIINNLEVGPGRTVSAAANDSWISGQVRTALIGTSDVPSNAFAITTHRGIVYLQGRVTQAEGNAAASVASGIRGVQKVVKLFEYISEEEARRTSTVAEESESQSNGTTAGTPAPTQQPTSSMSGGSEGGAQVIPIPAAP